MFIYYNSSNTASMVMNMMQSSKNFPRSLNYVITIFSDMYIKE